MALGVVSRRHGARLGVVVDEVPDAYHTAELNLDRDAPETTFTRGDRAIERLRNPERGTAMVRLARVLALDARPEFETESTAAPLDSGLNEPQLSAVRRALSALDVALVLGPPGTGKTRTLVEIIRQAALTGRVLVTAASNVAVDTVAERLVAAKVALVRIGHPARVLPEVEAYTLDAQLEASGALDLAREWQREAAALRHKIAARSSRGTLDRDERRELLSEMRRLQTDARHARKAQELAIVARSRVICATAAGADAEVLEDQHFDWVVLDEATQAVDPIALVALLRGARVVLAGDPHQLPPTVIDPQALQQGLGSTFFERLFATHGEHVTRLLTVQHRMHAAIMAFPSQATYGNQLVAHPSVASHTLDGLDVAPDPLREAPFVLIDTVGKGFDEVQSEEDPSTRNPDQADRTVAEVRRLVSRGLSPTLVGLITPYDGQVRLLRERLGDLVALGLEVASIDGFQGREKEAIVVDLVRSNPEGRIGFLADARRLNVALTRARRLLLVVGDSGTLGGKHSTPYLDALLAHADATGATLSAWADDAEPV